MRRVITQETMPHCRMQATLRSKLWIGFFAVIAMGLSLNIVGLIAGDFRVAEAAQQPTITCPQNVSATAGAGATSVAVNYPAPTATPTGATVACTPASGSNFPVGVTTVNCTATSGQQTASCSFTVTVTGPPTIMCPPNQTITSNNPAGAVVVYPRPVSNDPNAAIACVPPPDSVFPPGTTTVMCMATNAAGNASCSFTVTVNTPPAITCSSNITVVSETPTAVQYAQPIVTGTGVTTTCMPASGSTFPVGTTTVTCTAMNAVATVSCSFTVTVMASSTPPTPGRNGGCVTMCFRSPQYYLLNLNRLPGGTVVISGVNGNRPISTSNKDLIELALRGNPTGFGSLTPQQRFNQEFVATQLSLNARGGPASPALLGPLASALSCYGVSFDSVTLRNNATLSTSSSLKDLVDQAHAAIRENRAADFGPLADILDKLNGNEILGRCVR